MRNTKQKQLILQIIEKAQRPLTIEELLKLGQKELPNLGVATVYREISRLCENEQLQTVAISNDPIRYELAKHHHHHFKCSKCKKVYELEECSTKIKELVPKGFKLVDHDLTFYGLCAKCN